MSAKNRKQIVIDANVSLSASGDERFNPQITDRGGHSRKCLQAVWEEKHVAVFNRKLRSEWEKHASSHARAWLARMTLKDRILDREGEQFSKLLDPAYSCHEIDAHRLALAKDFHLIQSALATGQLILSNETAFPRHVAVSCAAVPQLAELHYGNPAAEGDKCRLWLKSGAEKEPKRRIDVWARNFLHDE